MLCAYTDVSINMYAYWPSFYVQWGWMFCSLPAFSTSYILMIYQVLLAVYYSIILMLYWFYNQKEKNVPLFELQTLMNSEKLKLCFCPTGIATAFYDSFFIWKEAYYVSQGGKTWSVVMTSMLEIFYGGTYFFREPMAGICLGIISWVIDS